MEARLKSEIWAKALVRRWQAQFVPVMVCNRGDSDAGAILVKVNRFADGCRVYSQTRDPDGNRAWMKATGAEPVDEKAADDYIARQMRFDPDIWVLEVEDNAGIFEFDEPVIG
jgi:hypothetical protein